MKKSLAKKITLSILAGAVLMSNNVVWAEEQVGVTTSGVPGSSDSTGWSSEYWPCYRPVKSDNSDSSFGNKVTIESVEFNHAFAGGYLTNGDVYGNFVTIENLKFITSHQVSNGIFGGWSENGEAYKNKINIISGEYDTYYIRGGLSDGDATDNAVNISDGTFTGVSIIGGQSDGDAIDNAVNISDGTFTGVSIAGGASDVDAIDNTVNISNGIFNDVDIYGGDSEGDVIDNTVDISGGTITGDVYGGCSLGDVANGNTVTITGGTITGDVHGGIVAAGQSSEATGNIVTIIGGAINGKIIGGGVAFTFNANKNTVNISNDANLVNADLFGGYQGFFYKGLYGGPSAPNTLNIGLDGKPWQATDDGTAQGNPVQNTVKSIQGFDVINFAYVNWDTTKPVVEVTEKLELESDLGFLGLNKTEIKVGTVNVASGTTLANGDKMALISVTENGTMTGTISNNLDKVIVNYGVAEKFNGYVEQVDVDKKIYLTLGDGPSEGYTVPQPKRNDQVLILGESRAAATAFTNQGSELVETGLDALARDNSKDTKVFAAIYGNHSEYETGSHVNVNGWSGIVGIGKTNADGLTVGAFFENGEGNYSTHNIFTNDYIRGDGEACYNGGGFLVRKDIANGVYAEASLRAGNLQNELRSAVRNGSELTGYDIDTFYYGAHVGIGKVIARGNDGDSLDVYGKFIYTHHDGETFDIGGTATKFDSVESERLRLGFRINEVQTNKLNMYYGAAWEYEFNGDAHDKIASFDLETPSLGGSTVIGEIGAHYKASDKWSLDLNGRAYVGQREGFSGSVQANYAF